MIKNALFLWLILVAVMSFEEYGHANPMPSDEISIGPGNGSQDVLFRFSAMVQSDKGYSQVASLPSGISRNGIQLEAQWTNVGRHTGGCWGDPAICYTFSDFEFVDICVPVGTAEYAVSADHLPGNEPTVLTIEIQETDSNCMVTTPDSGYTGSPDTSRPDVAQNDKGLNDKSDLGCFAIASSNNNLLAVLLLFLLLVVSKRNRAGSR